jgi:hypothetical protein
MPEKDDCFHAARKEAHGSSAAEVKWSRPTRFFSNLHLEYRFFNHEEARDDSKTKSMLMDPFLIHLMPLRGQNSGRIASHSNSFREQLPFRFQPDGFGAVFGLSVVNPQDECAQRDVFVSRCLGMDGIIVVMVFHVALDGLRDVRTGAATMRCRSSQRYGVFA